MQKPQKKNPAAVLLGRMGGNARKKVLSQERRTAIARLAAFVRWANKPKQE